MNIETMPPCQAACPIYTDVRGYVFALARNDVETAIRINRQVNPFPSVCGRICTRPCESACRRAQVDEPISISSLKRSAADQTKELNIIRRPEYYYDEKVAVIGGGPAGLTAAHDLALLGYKVTVFEEQKELGGMLSQGIPEYRLHRDVVKREINTILSLGIEAKTGLALGRDFTIHGLLEEYQAVFVAIGSQKSLYPKCKGIELSGVITAVEFLKQVSRGERPFLGDRVVVVGGGHTAVDAARTSLRLGSQDVTIMYRRTLEEMPAGRSEIEDAEKEGVKTRYLTAPVEFIGNEKVQKIKCIEMQLGDVDDSGRRRPVAVENSEFFIEADTVILAIGYIPEEKALKDSMLSLNKNSMVIVKDETGITNFKSVFAGGDVVSGPSSVIRAIAAGKRAADAIHRYFRKLPSQEVEKPLILEQLNDTVFSLIKKSDRQKMPVLPIEKRLGSFDEVELGFSQEQAVREAQRCLNCGAGALVSENCAVCLNCIRVCPYGVPVVAKDKVEIDKSQCQACGICASECPAAAITLAIETRDENKSALQNIIDKAMNENPELLIIGYYCRYGIPSGLLDKKGLYWIGKLCTGRLDVFQLTYPFELGVDGVVVHICKNEECRYSEGNRLLLTHIDSAKRLLDVIGLGSNRLKIVDEEAIPNVRTSFEALGRNPIREKVKV